MKIIKLLLAGSYYYLISLSLIVFFGSCSQIEIEQKYIGQTTALIPEAGTSTVSLKDGESGNTLFPFAKFKALATVGEIDKNSGVALTGRPDGHATWLKDNATVRLAYQSESYGTMGSSPNPETYPWVMESGVRFTGSHIHTIDYDRAGFANFMTNDLSAAEMFKGSGKLFHTIYNVFGQKVIGSSPDPTMLNSKWGNQTLPNGTNVQFSSSFRLSKADFLFQSFCGSWYEEANKYGRGVGFADDIWLAAEEWTIARMFPRGKVDANATMGLASLAVDIKNGIAYTAPALGQTGYEKMVPLNSGHREYVVIATSGYNHGKGLAPLRVYVGMKDRKPDGSKIDYATANERDRFLARNGLLFGKIYGMAISNQTVTTLATHHKPTDKMIDEYVQKVDAPKTFLASFVPTSYEWGGWDKPTAVQDTEMNLWDKIDEQPEGYIYFNGDTKVEHVAVDPSGAPRYFVNLTNKGALMLVDFGRFTFDGKTLPERLPATITRSIAAIDGSLTLKTGGGFKTTYGDASIHIETRKSKMVAPDGLYWTKTSEGDYLIVDEDSGNDFGERKYVLSLDSSLNISSGHLLAISGGKHSSRYKARVSAIGGAFIKSGSNEFSGSWPVTALIAKKSDGTFYTMDELKGRARQDIRERIATSGQTYIGVVQAPPESSGPVLKNDGDTGGQIFMFTMDPSG